MVTARPHSLKQRKVLFDRPRICNKTEVRVVSASGENRRQYLLRSLGGLLRSVGSLDILYDG